VRGSAKPSRRKEKAGAERPGLAARQVATSLLSAVLDERRSLDGLLDPTGGLPAYRALPDRDRRLVHAIVGTGLRRHGEIRAALDQLIEKRPPRKTGSLMRAIEIAATQILFMGIADHAAVSVALDQLDADPAARHYKGFANAVLRRLARERDGILAGSSLRLNTPDWLWSRWAANYGDAAADQIAAAHLVEPSLDLTVKGDPGIWAERLGGIVLPTGSIRLVPAGPIDDLPGFAEGSWWVQDAAAALPARLLGDVAGMRVADLCAAPGGKTAQLAQAGAKVTAVDISATRLDRLTANLARLGLSAETVAADVLTWKPDEPFDAVLLDAPCTSTGTIRRHPDIPWLKRPDDIPALAELQAKMIDRAVGMLKSGGTLIYCTCSLEPDEGEAQLARALVRHPLSLIPVVGGEIGGLIEAVTPAGTVRTLPTQLPLETTRLSGLDGFFISRLRKH
jgi:16S rRNA (cytosine967-C5)-methyltransferase